MTFGGGTCTLVVTMSIQQKSIDKYRNREVRVWYGNCRDRTGNLRSFGVVCLEVSLEESQ